MPQIAGLRGVLPDPSKLSEIAAAPVLDVAKGLSSGALIRDPGRAVYRYHQVFADPGTSRALVRKMVVCAVRLEPWTEGLIRPHEAAAPAATATALTALRATQVSPPAVLAGYRDAAGEVERLFRKLDGERPTLELTTADRTVHRLWRSNSAELFGQLRRGFAPKKLIVLDGHDRFEAMLAYRDELAAKRPLAMYSSANYALMCLVNLDDPALRVAPRHRVITGLGGLGGAATSEAALAAARPFFIIEKLAGAAGDPGKLRAALADTVAHQPAFVVAWSGEPDAWKLTLSPDISPVAAGVPIDRALQKLDPIVVDRLFVERALPGAKIATTTSAEAALAAKADAVIIMRAMTIEQITHIADLGQALPAGSTAFTPALVSALVSNVIDPDEDLV